MAENTEEPEKAVEGKDLKEIKSFLKGRLDINLLERRSSKGANSRERIYSRMNVFILFLLQILTGRSCGHMVRFLQGAVLSRKAKQISSNSSAYCQGRRRLELAIIKTLFRKLTDFLSGSLSESWKGLKVFVVDGTGLDMPDTPANRKAYSPRREQSPGTGVPFLNLVAVFELFSGAAIDWEKGNKHRGEQSLWKRLINRICMKGTLILGDAYYCSYGNIATIIRKGGDCIFPMGKTLNLKKERKLGKKDWLVTLYRPASRACTWTRKQWKSFPSKLELRLIEISLDRPGFKKKKIRLLTTLTDHELYTAEEVAGIQKRRWDAELRIRDIKTAMGMNHLSCKTPAMVNKEIFMFFTAYNFVRSLMAEASRDSGIPASRISFKSACALTEEWMRVVFIRKPNLSKLDIKLALLDMLAEAVNPQRPGRAEPRVIKVTEQRFPKMKQARKSYPEYRKSA